MAFTTSKIDEKKTIGRAEIEAMPSNTKSPLIDGADLTVNFKDGNPVVCVQEWTDPENSRSGEFPVVSTNLGWVAMSCFKTHSVIDHPNTDKEQTLSVTGLVDEDAPNTAVWDALVKVHKDKTKLKVLSVKYITEVRGRSVPALRKTIGVAE